MRRFDMNNQIAGIGNWICELLTTRNRAELMNHGCFHSSSEWHCGAWSDLRGRSSIPERTKVTHYR